MAKLEDVAQVCGGGTPSRSDASYFGGGIAWATPTDVTALDQLYISRTKETVSEEGLKNSSTKLMPAGAVLLTSRATIGFTAVSTVPICTNQGFINFVCGTELVPEYLAFWLRTQKDKMIQHAGGTTFKEIARGTLRKFELPVPPVAEQRGIVDVLSRAEGIVRLRREAEKKAAELIPALFLDMFGDPVSNPNGWPVEVLDSVCDIISGATKGRQLSADESIELPYMRVANVKDGHLDLSDVKTIIVKRSEVDKYRLVPGDLLLTEGGDPDKLGRGALWSGEIETCLHQNHIFKVRANRSKLLPEYLCELVGSHYGKAYFLRVAKKTTGIATINRTQLGRFPVVVPPLSRQAAFVEQLMAVRSIQSQQSTATSKAQAAFDALLADAFSKPTPKALENHSDAISA